MYVDTDAHAAAKASRADLMTQVRDTVDADAKTRAQIESDANMPEGDLDRVLAADYITLEQAHEIFQGLSNFDKDGGTGLTFSIDNSAPA